MAAEDQSPYEERFARNAGIVLDQDTLRSATVAIAGCGRAGAAAGTALARMGVGAFRLADPDKITTPNISGMLTATTSRLGSNKAAALAADIFEINPEARVSVVEDGISQANVSAFLAGASIALDAIDFYRADVSVLLHRASREAGLVVLVGVPVAWNAFLFKFEPHGTTFERFVGQGDAGTSKGQPLEAPVAAFCPEVPGYIDSRVLLSVVKREIPIPSVAPGVFLVGAMLAAATYFELSGCKQLQAVPSYYGAEDLLVKSAKRRSLSSRALQWGVSVLQRMRS